MSEPASAHARVGERIRDVEELEDLLSEPTAEVVAALGRLPGDLILLGAGGKMGPTLARMARRASDLAGSRRRVIAASRFTSSGVREELERHGVETVAVDLLRREDVDRLPDAPNVVYLAGRKFGTSGDASGTWAMNVIAPSLVAHRYAGARVAAFSTGNVYPLVPATGRGSSEDDPPEPSGEYALSALGRERVLEHHSRRDGTPVAILRLNYAVEMRYGVLVDLARKMAAGEAVDLSMGYVNVIWQADANAAGLRALELASSPPRVLNIAGPEVLRVREVAGQLARLLGREPRLEGEEAADALLSDGSRARELFGGPRVDAGRLIAWTADWVRRGGEFLDRPTHFQTRDGRF